jgi:hypothetical protein
MRHTFRKLPPANRPAVVFYGDHSFLLSAPFDVERRCRQRENKEIL